MLKDFNFNTFETGMVVVTNKVGILIEEGNEKRVVFKLGGQIVYDNTNSQMQNYFKKIYKPKSVPDVIRNSFLIYKQGEEFMKDNPNFELIYDRDYVKEITMAEVEEKFGCKVKIIE